MTDAGSAARGAALQIAVAHSPADVEIVRGLLREYQALLGVDLSFQDFATEVQELPGDYAPPGGNLLLARHGGEPVGCVALRAAGGNRCEMKRLFVRPAARGLGAGAALVMAILREARALGYAQIVLDTLPTMGDAQRLYQRFGFRDVAAYRHNPIDGTRYLARSLVEPD